VNVSRQIENLTTSIDTYLTSRTNLPNFIPIQFEMTEMMKRSPQQEQEEEEQQDE